MQLQQMVSDMQIIFPVSNTTTSHEVSQKLLKPFARNQQYIPTATIVWAAGRYVCASGIRSSLHLLMSPSCHSNVAIATVNGARCSPDER